jgi:hypothetical protein
MLYTPKNTQETLEPNTFCTTNELILISEDVWMINSLLVSEEYAAQQEMQGPGPNG